MKNLKSIVLSVSLTLAAGCAATKAPTGIEKELYNITTNVVQQTNTAPVTATNWVTVTNTVNGTNQVTLTNFVTKTVEAVPVAVTNYTYAVKTGTTAAIDGAATVGNMVMPGAGTIGSLILAGLLGMWGSFRSKQASTATAVNATLSQAIATAQAVISKASPATAVAFNTWLAGHQSDANLAGEIAGIVDTFVDPAQANGVAISLIHQAATPIPVAGPPAPAAP